LQLFFTFFSKLFDCKNKKAPNFLAKLVYLFRFGESQYIIFAFFCQVLFWFFLKKILPSCKRKFFCKQGKIKKTQS